MRHALSTPAVRAERLRMLAALWGEERHLTPQQAAREGLAADGSRLGGGALWDVLADTMSADDFALAGQVVTAGAEIRDRQWRELEALLAALDAGTGEGVLTRVLAIEDNDEMRRAVVRFVELGWLREVPHVR